MEVLDLRAEVVVVIKALKVQQEEVLALELKDFKVFRV
jgi:hypothetical protein